MIYFWKMYNFYIQIFNIRKNSVIGTIIFCVVTSGDLDLKEWKEASQYLNYIHVCKLWVVFIYLLVFLLNKNKTLLYKVFQQSTVICL